MGDSMKKGSGITLPSKKRAAATVEADQAATPAPAQAKKPNRKVITYRTSEERRDALAAHAFNNKTSIQVMIDQALVLLAVELDIDLPEVPED